jgi:Cof subfamily protein (haloacid dehalogenase superfamily)
LFHRAICFDIDGTLLDSQGVLRPRVAQALHALHDAGTTLLVATAVPQRFARLKVAQAPFLCQRGVFMGGAHVVDEPTGLYYQAKMDLRVTQDLVRSLIAWYPGLQILLQIDPDRYALRLPMVDESPEDWGYAPDALLPFDEAIARPCLKIVAWQEEANLARMLADLQARLGEQVSLFPSEDGSGLWASACDTDKGSGLLRLLAHLQISPAETVVIGDHTPDLDMFRVAGTSIAMGNAPAEVQAAATWVTATNDEDGVALAIERLLAP